MNFLILLNDSTLAKFLGNTKPKYPPSFNHSKDLAIINVAEFTEPEITSLNILSLTL